MSTRVAQHHHLTADPIHTEVLKAIPFQAEAAWKEVLPILLVRISIHLPEVADHHLHIAADLTLQDLHQSPLQEVLPVVVLHPILLVLLQEDQDGDNLTQ